MLVVHGDGTGCHCVRGPGPCEGVGGVQVSLTFRGPSRLVGILPLRFHVNLAADKFVLCFSDHFSFRWEKEVEGEGGGG